MDEIIRITSVVIYDNGIVSMIGYTANGILDVFYIDKHVLKNMFIGPGDIVKIEYREEANKPKEIKKITEWRIGRMKEKLIKIIDECVAEQKKRVGELNAFLGKYELSESGINNAREKTAEELRKFIEGKVVELNRLFEEKINQLNEEEQKEVEKKNDSLEFQQMMHEKAGVLKLLDCSKIDGNVLKNYLKEFENYPVAVALFQSCCIGRENYTNVIGCLPEDTRGVRQDRMRMSQADAVACLEGLIGFDTRGNNTQIAMVKSCRDYIENQEEDFSLATEAVWGKMKQSESESVNS